MGLLCRLRRPSSQRTTARITLRGTRLPAPLSLDGNLDEAIYRDVTPLDHFIQQEPNEGQPATEKTVVWLFFDDENFYVSVRILESAQRDQEIQDERSSMLTGG